MEERSTRPTQRCRRHHTAGFTSQYGSVVFLHSTATAVGVNISGNTNDTGAIVGYHAVGNGTLTGSLPALRQACDAGGIAYAPARNWNSGILGVRVDVVSLSLEDAGGLQTTIFLNLKVLPVNDAPLLASMVSHCRGKREKEGEKERERETE